MYNAYGHHVYKKYQVNMGNPYSVKQKVQPVPQKNEKITDPKISAEEEAETIIKKARLEAEQIITEANREASDVLESAQEKVMAHMLEVEQSAKEEGYRNGESQARQHYQSLIDEAESLRQEAQKAYENTVASLEGEMVETILQIARKVIGMELTQNNDVIIGLIQTTMLGSSPADEIVVRVCQDDYDYAVENKDRLLKVNKNIRDITIMKDSSLEKGACLVETGYGSVDGSIDTQLEAVERSFREFLSNYPEEDEMTEE